LRKSFQNGILAYSMTKTPLSRTNMLHVQGSYFLPDYVEPYEMIPNG
jgi:hypothetical protein